MAVLKLKREPKNKSVSTKITEVQSDKLDKLAQKHDITKSALMAHLIEMGYLELSGNKSF